MHPSHIRAHADHRLTTLRRRASLDRLAPFAGGMRRKFAAGLRAWAAHVDGRSARPARAPGAA